MEMEMIIGENIKKIKEKLNLTNDDLGKILGVTRQTVTKYMNGEQTIDSVKLFNLASYCNVPVKYFLEESEKSLSFMFRADNSKDNFDMVTALKVNNKLISYCELAKLVQENEDVYIPEVYKLSISGKSLSEADMEKIHEIAERQRRAIGLDDEIDIYRVLEDNGIHVYSMKLDLELDALSAYSESYGAFILINDHKEIPEERKRFSCAHEYGHLILHREDYKQSNSQLGYSSYKNEIREKMANVFASYLLIPRNILHKEFKRVMGRRKYVEFSDIIILKKRFYVSAQALIYALKDEGLISGGVYGTYFKFINENFGNGEPEPLVHIEKNQKLFSIIRNLAKDEEISTNKVAEMLDLSLLEARDLIKVWSNNVLS